MIAEEVVCVQHVVSHSLRSHARPESLTGGERVHTAEREDIIINGLESLLIMCLSATLIVD